MAEMMMMRRFVNLVSQKWFGSVHSSTSSIYSLHRLDVANHLFYPSTADAEKAKAESAANEKDGGAAWPPAMQRLRLLPAPTMFFQGAPSAHQLQADARFFALLSPRDSDGRVLFSNKLGQAMLYDADTNCIDAMPLLAGQFGCRPITISLARPGAPELQDLYVMHSAATADCDDTCFGVLRVGDRSHSDTCWEHLPAPPLGRCTPICSHAVVDGAGGPAICVSAQSVPGYGPTPPTDGTYCFDTVKREWRRAGDWMLPFEGGAKQVDDLWLGFAGEGRNLCAATGLSATMEKESETAPALQHVWRDVCKVPDNWRTTCPPQLLDLGGDRFCIAKTCTVMPDTEYDEYAGPGIEVAVLCGVELLTGGDSPSGSIDIVEHKSLGYRCHIDSIRWVI